MTVALLICSNLNTVLDGFLRYVVWGGRLTYPKCFSLISKLSTYIVNKIGDNTPPCFTPFCNMK